MNMLQKIAVVVMILFYLSAGIKHFTAPEGYLIIMPSYLPWPNTLSYLAGFFEIAFAILLYFKKTRVFASWAIILMLLAFLPVHIYMIQKANLASYVLGKWTITPLLAWLRLPLQLVLIWWAYWCSKIKISLI